MLLSFVIWFLAVCMLLLPLMFWMYVYACFSSWEYSQKYFLMGGVIGAISSGIFVFYDTLGLSYFLQNIFFHLTFIKTSFLGLALALALWKFFLVFACFWVCIWALFRRYAFGKNSFLFVKSFVFLCVLLVFFSCISYIVDFVFPIQYDGVMTKFWDYSFIFLGSIIWYYIIISLLEEGMKYFWALTYMHEETAYKNLKHFIFVAVSIALGFSVSETFFYTYQYYMSWNTGTELLGLIFFRSVFVSSVHVFCSLLVSIWFWYLLSSSSVVWRSIKYFLIFAVFGLLSHAFFDVSISYWYIAVVFLYIFFLYIFMSYFLMQDISPDDTVSV